MGIERKCSELRSERCERCPDEDTAACEDCEPIKADMEIKLKGRLEDEANRIRGD